MAEKIRMVYEHMHSMVSSFDNAVTQLDATIGRLKGMVGALQEGALLGTAGDTVCAAVNSDLLPAIERLKQKMLEESGDVQANIDLMQEAEGEARSIPYN